MDKVIVVFDIDGVVRDVGGSYRRAIADTVEHFTDHLYRPTSEDIDELKSEGIWNNDWQASQELILRYWEDQGFSTEEEKLVDYQEVIAFFQDKYRGESPDNWNGYITDEPLLMTVEYLASLTNAGMAWGFFSGAMREEALYVLVGKLNIENPVLIAMEDAPGKPNPQGLFLTVDLLTNQDNLDPNTPVIYVGDTVADMHTVRDAKRITPSRNWLGVGILPPHVNVDSDRALAYSSKLQQAGAIIVLPSVNDLTPEVIQNILS